jgi:hypothetical protein
MTVLLASLTIFPMGLSFSFFCTCWVWATGAGALLSNPLLAGALPLQSPRLMGEAAYYAGKGSKLMPPLTKQQELARALMLQQKTQGVPNE